MPVMLVRAVAAEKADGQVRNRGRWVMGCLEKWEWWEDRWSDTHTPSILLDPTPPPLYTFIHQQAYQCPVYRTEQRGPTYVFTAQLKTKSPPARWVMAGVGLIMDVAS